MNYKKNHFHGHGKSLAYCSSYLSSNIVNHISVIAQILSAKLQRRCWHARRARGGELQRRRNATTREVGDDVGGRRPGDADVCGLRATHQRPVLAAGSAGPRVACGLPQMHRLWTVSGRNVHLFRTRRKDLLSSRLHQVGSPAVKYY